MKLSAPIFRLKRDARRIARAEGIALHAALDKVAQREGVARWSLLAERVTQLAPGERILDQLSPGDLLLLAARPGQGKTRLGLQLVVDALCEGRRAAFFSLEYTETETVERLRSLGLQPEAFRDTLTLVTSDDICAEQIIETLSAGPAVAVAVIDYLQVLDQRRTKPELAEQVAMLSDFAKRSGTTLAFISQIDRSFDPAAKALPDMRDLRLPNPIDVSVFSKACFLNGSEMRLSALR